MERQSRQANQNYNYKQKQNVKLMHASVKCLNSHKATHVCFSNDCQQSAFMCSQSQCNCKSFHQDCLKILFDDLIQKIYKKLNNLDPLIQAHNLYADSFIQNVLKRVQKIKKQFKQFAQEKYKYLSLSQGQKNIWKKISQNNTKDIKGRDFFKVCTQMSDRSKKSCSAQLDEEISTLKLMWTCLQKRIDNQFVVMSQKLYSSVAHQLQNHQIWLFQSKIVKSLQQNQVIKGFFDKKIKSFQKLYVASENSFKLDNFYKNCTNIQNTLLLIQTQYDKKIGGFTGLTWKHVDKQQILLDESNQTFIFSLTNNQKFKQIDGNSGITNYPQYGPRFSRNGNDDILIRNQANKNSFSCGCFNKAFTNQKNSQQNLSALKRFNGNPNHSAYFKIKQWQIWRICFQ